MPFSKHALAWTIHYACSMGPSMQMAPDVVNLGQHLPCVKLEHVQHAGHPHLEEHRRGAGAELHDVAQLRRVQVLFWHRPEEVHAPVLTYKGSWHALRVNNAPSLIEQLLLQSPMCGC
jgi:hypothetical protein